MEYSADVLLNDDFVIVVIAMIVGLFVIIALFLNLYLPFKEEKDYIKMEMARSFDKKEYLYWKGQLKKLYISKIPIVRSISGRKQNR